MFQIISHVRIADHETFIKWSTPEVCELIIASNPHVYKHMVDITKTSSLVSEALSGDINKIFNFVSELFLV